MACYWWDHIIIHNFKQAIHEIFKVSSFTQNSTLNRKHKNHRIKKISAPRGNSFREIVYGSPFICVLNILVGLFTHTLIYLFIWSLVFSYGEDPYDIQPANSIQTILYCFIVISHLFHTLKFSIWTITTTWICTRRV